MDAPPFETEFLHAFQETLSQPQRHFYCHWVKEWQAGNFVQTNGNDGYILCYLNELFDRDTHFPRVVDGHIMCYAKPSPPKHPRLVASECLRLAKERIDETTKWWCKNLASECYVLMGEYRNALDAYPRPPIGVRNALQTDILIDLKRLVGERIDAADILTLNGPRTTRWGMKHIPSITKYIDIAVRAYEDNTGLNLIEDWASDSHKHPYSLFRGSVHLMEAPIVACSYSMNPRVEQFVTKLTRDAENTVREEQGIPRIGEGWVGETTLFYELKAAFPTELVIQHAQPEWLGLQHLDVFFPARAVGIEYQGPQHDEPVHYFGGVTAFQEVQERDSRKLRRCTDNGVRIIYVRAGYVLEEIVNQIKGGTVSG